MYKVNVVPGLITLTKCLGRWKIVYIVYAFLFIVRYAINNRGINNDNFHLSIRGLF